MTDWSHLAGLSPYLPTLAAMEDRVAAIHEGRAPEAVWLLEHPPLYTAGTSAHEEDLVERDRFPVFKAGRGGQYTYHGPGQRVVYCMLDVGARGRDVRCFVRALENWVIATLAEFNVTGEIRPGRVGVWVSRPDKPRLADGTPFPTVYYLTHPAATAALSGLEAAGKMVEYQDRLATDEEFAAAYQRAHEAYIADRDAISAAEGTPPVSEVAGISAGGMPTRVKCLHSLVAHSLSAGPDVNPLGDEALAKLPEWWKNNPCE
mgnify:CR=1 FL=1